MVATCKKHERALTPHVTVEIPPSLGIEGPTRTPATRNISFPSRFNENDTPSLHGQGFIMQLHCHTPQKFVASLLQVKTLQRPEKILICRSQYATKHHLLLQGCMVGMGGMVESPSRQDVLQERRFPPYYILGGFHGTSVCLGPPILGR